MSRSPLLLELLGNAVRRWRCGEFAHGTVSWHTFTLSRGDLARGAEWDPEVHGALASADYFRAADVVEFQLLPVIAGDKASE